MVQIAFGRPPNPFKTRKSLQKLPKIDEIVKIVFFRNDIYDTLCKIIWYSEKCERMNKKFSNFEVLWWPSQCDLDNFKFKKIRFFFDFGRFLSFKGALWPSQCELHNFQLIFCPLFPIFYPISRIFEIFWPIFSTN